MARFYNYTDVEKFYTKARNKDKGRPLGTWGRVIRERDNYKFYAHPGYSPEPFGVFTSDNVFTFLYTGSQVRNISATLTGHLHRTLPFYIQRVAKHRYNVVHVKIPKGGTPGYEAPKAYGHEMFPGIQFDMHTGQCFNPKDLVVSVINPDARRVWLRSLRYFKRQMHTRAKLGVFDTYVAQIRASKNNTIPDWTSELWLDALYKAIRDKQYEETLIMGLACHAIARLWYRGALTYDHVVAAIDDVCSIASLDLRRRFGVFEGVE